MGQSTSPIQHLCDTWPMALGPGALGLFIWFLFRDKEAVYRGAWAILLGPFAPWPWAMVLGPCPCAMVLGAWPWPMVLGPWSLGLGPWCLILENQAVALGA